VTRKLVYYSLRIVAQGLNYWCEGSFKYEFHDTILKNMLFQIQINSSLIHKLKNSHQIIFNALIRSKGESKQF
jgi:hypothetical protein